MLALATTRCDWTIVLTRWQAFPADVVNIYTAQTIMDAYLVQDRLEVGSGQVDGGGVTTGTRADDNNLGVHLLAYLAGPLGFPDAERAAVGVAIGDGRHGASFFVV